MMKASSTRYAGEDAFVSASPALYGVEDAMAVRVNTRILVLTSRMNNFNTWFQVLKSLNNYLSERLEDAHEVRELLAPPWPVMVAVITPVVKPGRDTLLGEDGVELTS